ncbi:hypothetical protein HDU78_001172 [Chytriomyces hyalinus]|nr:hypothetical protein HDU78_001172 [Chytriomyces hyalinus]
MFPSLLKTHSQSVTLGYSQRQLFAMVSDIGKYEQFVPWCVSSRILESRTLESGSKTVSRMKAQLGVGFKQFNEQYSSNVECTHSNDIRAVASDSSLFKTLNTTWALRPATHLSPDPNWKKPTASSYSMSHLNPSAFTSNSFDSSTVKIQQKEKTDNLIAHRRKFSSAELLKYSTSKTLATPKATSLDAADLESQQKDAVSPDDHPICTLDFYIAFEFKSILYAQVSELFFNQVSLVMVDSFVKRARALYGEPCPFRK